jgi:hypothetical protein
VLLKGSRVGEKSFKGESGMFPVLILLIERKEFIIKNIDILPVGRKFSLPVVRFDFLNCSYKYAKFYYLDYIGMQI